MKKFQHVLVVSALLLVSAGCNKDNSNSNNSGGGNSSTTIKYEVVTTANISTPPSSLYSYVTYTGSDGNGKEERNVMTSRTWAKTITLNVSTRPIGIGFSGQVWTTGPGSITSRVYINNELRETKTFQIVDGGTVFNGYWVNNYVLY